MKLKYYLRGCGVGILVTVVILMIAINAKGGIMTDQKAMRRAAELGMVMPGNTTGVEADSQTQAEPVTQEEPGTKNGSEARESTQTSPETKESNTSKKSTQAEEHQNLQEKKAEKTEKEEEESGKISISVQKGDVCRDVANKLFDEGLVEDAEEFRVYMGEHGYAKKLCVGDFSFEKGMTYQQIAEILTKQ